MIRGWLGVSVQGITEDIAKNLKLETEEGALVSDVFEGDPADKAGIRTGDVIIEVDGTGIKDTHELIKVVGRIDVGEKIKITVLRDGKRKTFRVTVTERPESSELAQGTRDEKSEAHLGITVQAITPEIAEHLDLADTNGVVVAQVETGSPADEAGLEGGDVILQINRSRITSLQDYRDVMARAVSSDSVLFLIQRGGSKFFAVINK